MIPQAGQRWLCGQDPYHLVAEVISIDSVVHLNACKVSD